MCDKTLHLAIHDISFGLELIDVNQEIINLFHLQQFTINLQHTASFGVMG